MSKPFLTVGSLTFDIFVRPEAQEIIKQKNKDHFALPFGEKVRVSDVHECFGGGAANVAVGLRRLGLPAMVIGAIGKDSWGEMIVKNLQKERVDSNHLQKAREKTGFSVILNAFGGERTVLGYAGANHSLEKINEKTLQEASGVHLCHLSGKSAQVFAALRAFFEKNLEKFLSWNPGHEQIIHGLKHFAGFLPVVDVLSLNREEAEEFTRLRAACGSTFGKNIYDLRPLMQAFYQTGFRGILVITDGRRGAQATDGKTLYHCNINAKSPRIDTLGAGDAFCSGFCWSIFAGKDLPSALKFGTMNAESVVSYFGAQEGLLTKAKINALTTKLKIQNKLLK